MYHFEKLEIWQKAMGLVDGIYDVTKSFPLDEKFALIDQIRRSTVSISANIAEGSGRNSKKEFIQFLMIARGSLYETVTLLMIAKKREYLGEPKYDELSKNIEAINMMLSKLISSCRSSSKV